MNADAVRDRSAKLAGRSASRHHAGRHGFAGTLNQMRFGPALALLLAFAAAEGSAMTIDPKAMARFDNSYSKCEARFPEMRGARDEAYLSMWRIKADAKARAELDAVRKGAPYQSEARRIQGEDPKKAVAASTLEGQCQALWAETQRVRGLAH
jgi:hypothetical protein